MKAISLIIAALFSAPALASEAALLEILAAIAESTPATGDAQYVQADKPTDVAPSAGVQWTTWQAARQRGEGAVVLITQEKNCSACELVKRQVLTDPEVVECLGRYQCVQLDETAAAAWGVRSFPALVLVSPDWKIVQRIPCPTTVRDFLTLFPK